MLNIYAILEEDCEEELLSYCCITDRFDTFVSLITLVQFELKEEGAISHLLFFYSCSTMVMKN